MQETRERFPMTGILRITVRKGGEVVEEWEDHNLIVNGARNQAARLFAGNGENRAIAKIAFGTSGTAPAVTDTEITDAYTKAVSGFSFPDVGQVQTNWELGTSENNGMAIMEFGLLSADGTLLCRKVRENPIYKESDISIEGHWTWIF